MSKPTVLVAEDESALVTLLRYNLEREGYRVLEAANGLEALQCWNEEGGDVDLLLTDMRMPKEMSGHELAQNLRALKPELKVIYTTGYSPEVGGCELDLVEGSNFLPKPYPPMGIDCHLIWIKIQTNKQDNATMGHMGMVWI